MAVQQLAGRIARRCPPPAPMDFRRGQPLFPWKHGSIARCRAPTPNPAPRRARRARLGEEARGRGVPSRASLEVISATCRQHRSLRSERPHSIPLYGKQTPPSPPLRRRGRGPRATGPTKPRAGHQAHPGGAALWGLGRRRGGCRPPRLTAGPELSILPCNHQGAPCAPRQRSPLGRLRRMAG